MMDVRANASAVLPVLMSLQFCSYRSLAFDKEMIHARLCGFYQLCRQRQYLTSIVMSTGKSDDNKGIYENILLNKSLDPSHKRILKFNWTNRLVYVKKSKHRQLPFWNGAKQNFCSHIKHFWTPCVLMVFRKTLVEKWRKKNNDVRYWWILLGAFH